MAGGPIWSGAVSKPVPSPVEGGVRGCSTGRKRRAAARQARDLSPVPTNHRLLLLATPAFDLAFRTQRFITRRTVLREDTPHGAARCRVPTELATDMSGHPLLQVIGVSDIVRPVSAFAHIDPESHRLICGSRNALRDAAGKNGGSSGRTDKFPSLPVHQSQICIRCHTCAEQYLARSLVPRWSRPAGRSVTSVACSAGMGRDVGAR